MNAYERECLAIALYESDARSMEATGHTGHRSPKAWTQLDAKHRLAWRGEAERIYAEARQQR
jgi:hypothetical protein